MESKKRKNYTQGCEDVERVMDHLNNEYKKAQREKWLREHYSKAKENPKYKTKEEDNASNS